MSFLQLPDSTNIQIWNNAAFEDGASASKASTATPLRQISANLCGTLDLDPSKENRSPVAEKSVIDFRFHRKAAEDLEEGDVDCEIARIEEEIARLQSRLEALRLRKAEQRIAPAKILDLKQQGGGGGGSVARRNPCSPLVSKCMDLAMEPAPASAASGLKRRGASSRPVEILATPARPIELRSAAKNLWPSALKKTTTEDSSLAVYRRGDNLSPIEIHQNSLAPDRSGKATETSRSVEDCKKQSVRKPEHIGEDKGTNKERGANLNPKSQPPETSKTSKNLRQPSAGSKKAAKGDHFSATIRPKALFQESCRRQPNVAAKMRVVPSRYTQVLTSEELGGNRRKCSSPELTARVASAGSKLEEQIKTDSRMSNGVDVTVVSFVILQQP